MIKADLKRSSVASASVLAKVERDELMITLRRRRGHVCALRLGDNKGYSALSTLRPWHARVRCALHRRSWRLPGS